MRLFFALWPPFETARALAGWAREAQRQTGGKPVEEAKIHLTLAFLGEADPSRAIAAARRAHGVSHQLPLEEARYWRENGIVWAGPRKTPVDLAVLANGLIAQLRNEKFILEKRPFAAHVTLIRKARAPRSLPPLPEVAWPVHEFLLVRSPSYEPLERLPLENPG